MTSIIILASTELVTEKGWCYIYNLEKVQIHFQEHQKVEKYESYDTDRILESLAQILKKINKEMTQFDQTTKVSESFRINYC